jgi:drug/metabolite transporter (DMT)-like permease
MRSSFFIAMVIAVSGQVLYHVAQKSVPTGTNPVIALLIFYLGAAILTLPLFVLYPIDSKLTEELGKLNWAVLAVAASIVLIEIGFLLAYRFGGELSNTFVATAAIVTTCTFIVGVIAFNESINVYKVAGTLLCIGGIAMISYRPG